MYRDDYAAMTADEMRAQVELLESALEAHPLAARRTRWETLGRAYATWPRNTELLRLLLEESEANDELKIELVQNVRPDGVRVEFFASLDQFLFNTLAAAVALVERTNGLRGDYPGADFEREFATRNGAVAQAPATKFLRRFRNYLLHVGAAPFSTTLSFGQDHGPGLTLRVWLDTGALLERADFWDAGSREFLPAHPDGVHLRQVVEEYRTAMTDLFEWTFSQYGHLHASEIESANDLVRRINLTRTGGVSDGSDWQGRMRDVEENLRAAREGRAEKDYDGEGRPSAS